MRQLAEYFHDLETQGAVWCLLVTVDGCTMTLPADGAPMLIKVPMCVEDDDPDALGFPRRTYEYQRRDGDTLVYREVFPGGVCSECGRRKRAASAGADQ